MPSSNILLFDANKANMMSDEQYNTNTQRLNGVQSGIASSQLQNKTLYQVSLVAYAIAQIMNQNGLDANDTAAVSAFVANLSGTMLQKVADLASTQEAQAGVATGKWMSPALVKAAMDTYTSNKWLPLTGGTMKGNLILNADPTTNLGAATKQYADNIKGSANLFKKRLALSQTRAVSREATLNFGVVPRVNIGEIGAMVTLKMNNVVLSSTTNGYISFLVNLGGLNFLSLELHNAVSYNQEFSAVNFLTATDFYDSYEEIYFIISGSARTTKDSLIVRTDYTGNTNISGTITANIYYF